MTKAEKVEFIRKATLSLSKLLPPIFINGYTRQDVGRICDIVPTRFSEILAFDYNDEQSKPTNEAVLRKLILGGFVTVDKIIEKASYTKKERMYLEEFRLFENMTLVNNLNRIKNKGVNPELIVDLVLKLQNTGKNPVDILKNALK